MTRTFEYYEQALAGKSPPISESDPQPGYYKLRVGKGQPYEPVAIWEKPDGTLTMRLGDLEVDPHDYWTWCADKPVTKEDAKIAFKTGVWPGDVPLPAAIGDNSGELTLDQEIKDYMETAQQWAQSADLKDVTKETADMAANYASHLGTLAGAFESKRKDLIRPHLDAQREINSYYNPILDEVKKAIKSLKKITGIWLQAEQEKHDKVAKDLDLAPAEAPRARAGGQRGRRVGLRTVVKCEVKDQDAVLAWALEHHKRDMIRRACELAEVAVKQGQEVPGAERVETKEAV